MRENKQKTKDRLQKKEKKIHDNGGDISDATVVGIGVGIWSGGGCSIPGQRSAASGWGCKRLKVKG